MITTLVHVSVKPEYIDAFIAATKLNHEGSIKESGNRRFDVIQSTTNPGQFILYEIFESEQAFAKHRETEHYLTWRDTVTDWMAEPRQGVRYNTIFPAA